MFKIGSRRASPPGGGDASPDVGEANVLKEKPNREQDENKVGRRHQQQQSRGYNKSNKENRGGRRRQRIKWNQVAMMTTNPSPTSTPQQYHSKPHDAPMTKSDLYFALDCEMVGVGQDGLDSALARVCIVNWENKVVLDTFVKVPVPVTDYRTYVSGVRPEDIESDSAMAFEDCRQVVSNILNGKILIGHGLVNDLKSLRLSHPLSDVRDTTTYSPLMRETVDPVSGEKVLRPRKLREITFEKLGRNIQIGGIAHSPKEDAIAALDLYKYTRRDWEQHLIKESMEKNRQMENHRMRLNSQLYAASVRTGQQQQQQPRSPYVNNRLTAVVQNPATVAGPPSPTNMHQGSMYGMVQHRQGGGGYGSGAYYHGRAPPPQAQSSYFGFPTTLVPTNLSNNKNRKRWSKEILRDLQEIQNDVREQQQQQQQQKQNISATVEVTTQ